MKARPCGLTNRLVLAEGYAAPSFHSLGLEVCNAIHSVATEKSDPSCCARDQREEGVVVTMPAFSQSLQSFYRQINWDARVVVAEDP